MSDAEIVIIVPLVDVNGDVGQQAARLVPGSVIDICSSCERSVWASPPSVELIYKTNNARFMCVECAVP